MRAAVGAVLAAVLLVWAAPAQAYDFGKDWGYAVVDDKPFTDPGTGALLPATQVFPRGRIKDKDANDCSPYASLPRICLPAAAYWCRGCG